MPRKLPPHVERNFVKGRAYLYFRMGRGKRVRLPDDPTSDEFKTAYAACLSGALKPRSRFEGAQPRSIAALVASYKASRAYLSLRDTTKRSYSTPLEMLREQHGHRSVEGFNKQRIEEKILAPYADRPGQQLAILKLLRVLINHARRLTPPWLNSDPSAGIERTKGGEIRAWTDAELAKFEHCWKVGTKQRTAYELMLNTGTARSDVHAITWKHLDEGGVSYARSKTGVAVDAAQTNRLRNALAAWPRRHVTVLYTDFGKAYTVKGFGNFMRDAITAAGLPMDCKPHGLRKTLGRRLADAGVSAHDIMAALGHKTLAEAQRYTREADRRRGGKRAAAALDAFEVIEGRKENGDAQTQIPNFGPDEKAKGN